MIYRKISKIDEPDLDMWSLRLRALAKVSDSAWPFVLGRFCLIKIFLFSIEDAQDMVAPRTTCRSWYAVTTMRTFNYVYRSGTAFSPCVHACAHTRIDSYACIRTHTHTHTHTTRAPTFTAPLPHTTSCQGVSRPPSVV